MFFKFNETSAGGASTLGFFNEIYACDTRGYCLSCAINIISMLCRPTSLKIILIVMVAIKTF